jgi:hypothetical protein
MELWKRFCREMCSHQFTWPRLSANGKHYQICLLCGNEYEYDWNRMQRTNRLLVTNIKLASAQARWPGTVN